MVRKITIPSILKIVKDTLDASFVLDRGEKSNSTERIIYAFALTLRPAHIEQLNKQKGFEVTYLETSLGRQHICIHVIYNPRKK